MSRKKVKNGPETQHTKVVSRNGDIKDYVVLDNPDDRMTRQTGSGTTLVKNDSPDDVEMK